MLGKTDDNPSQVSETIFVFLRLFCKNCSTQTKNVSLSARLFYLFSPRFEFLPLPTPVRLQKFEFFLISRLGLQKTPTASPQRGKTPRTSVLDMTLNNLMVRLPPVLGNLEYPFMVIAQVLPLWPGVVAPDSILSMGQIEVFGI